MSLIFNGGGDGGGIQPTGKTEQSIEGNIDLISTDGTVALGLESDNGNAEVKLTESGNLELSATNGDVVVDTPDGTNEDAVVNVAYVNSVVGDIEEVLAEI